MADALDEVLAKLAAAGLPHDREGTTLVLDGVFEKYEQHRQLMSRDSLSTVPEVAASASTISASLEHIAHVCLNDMHLLQWLEEYAKDVPPMESPSKFGANFLNPLIRCLGIARVAEANLRAAAARDEPLIVTKTDGTKVEHRRRTRTESRDSVLIPSLVGFLYLIGLRLRHGDDWDLEALDAACEIVERALIWKGVQAPDAGNTELGETHQGRLRRAIKSAYDTLPASLTNRGDTAPS